MFWTNQVQMKRCGRKVTSGRKVAGAISSLVNAKDLQLECVRVLHDVLLVPVLMYSSEKMPPQFQVPRKSLALTSRGFSFSTLEESCIMFPIYI